ncbi:hypothetical protein DS745_20125 [Anaerobacillus alkaliphilus]|uniref:YtzH-like protein n=1 Tax=Anaerobacillus alkaliphilus TaxID=1548597 RepID=A0A4Q0VRL7_9BACI|nr:YtzH-like family protein [Anaerobacillus alkaliphilus]RXI98625.1 hypothetical protein DS745_20125 [Anaerobacillus alkaliphilus]
MNYQDQLTLLSDILKNQQQAGFGTEDEFSQMSRLALALQNQEQLDQTMKQTMASISSYCTNGNCNENTSQLDQWIESIENFK